ncbi:site-specific tyrosine recombinase XerD [Luteitalea pratensis]|uniref:Site-specific tyrosine recombinase XerD n=1 Tax=Luteitalea pratensis TaxID=1855912 RepID=A0A143PPU7_LUTPR|nr:site-specific integrase [Luteitalea pratensis]AMY10148.1 site-specific tyrosine recombinase XerD [Luteitalea pratensis]
MPKVTHNGLTKRCECKQTQWTKCAHPWIVRFHTDGREHFVSLHKYVGWPKGSVMPKTQALKLVDKVRTELRDGQIRKRSAATATTVGAVIEAYRERFVRVPTRRQHARVSMEGHLDMVARLSVPDARGRQVPFVDLRMRDVTPATIEALRHARRLELAAADAAYTEVVRLTGAGKDVPTDLRRRSRLRTRGKGGEVGLNRLLARLRHLFSWAIARYQEIEHHPFRKGGIAVVKLAKETARSRRLRAGEEDGLMMHAGPHLKSVILAGLQTGARIGELLSLQWHQVERDAQDRPVRLRLTADKTKTSRTRILPVPRMLAAILDMRQTAPDGRRHGDHAYVFGNEVGEQVERVQTAWETCCRAAGIAGLHFHDLRREFGSRLLDAGVPLTTIQTYLGHTSVTTTAKYLEADQLLVATAVDAIERGWSDDRIRTLFGLSPETPEATGVGGGRKLLN